MEFRNHNQLVRFLGFSETNIKLKEKNGRISSSVQHEGGQNQWKIQGKRQCTQMICTCVLCFGVFPCRFSFQRGREMENFDDMWTARFSRQFSKFVWIVDFIQHYISVNLEKQNLVLSRESEIRAHFMRIRDRTFT